jgi:hypothetical protein
MKSLMRLRPTKIILASRYVHNCPVCVKINCVIMENFHVHIWNRRIRIDVEGRFPYKLRVDYCLDCASLSKQKCKRLKACGRNKDSSCISNYMTTAILTLWLLWFKENYTHSYPIIQRKSQITTYMLKRHNLSTSTTVTHYNAENTEYASTSISTIEIITITFLDSIHRPVLYLKRNISETGFSFRFQVAPTQFCPVERASLRIRMEKESSLRNVMF